MESLGSLTEQTGRQLQCWLTLASREQSKLDVLLKLSEKELTYTTEILEMLLKGAIRATTNKASSATSGLVQRLTNNLINYFSQLTKAFQQGPVTVHPAKIREMSVQVGYESTCLCERLCLAYQRRELLCQKQYGQALKKMYTSGTQGGIRQSWTTGLVQARTLTSRLLLQLALSKDYQLDLLFRTVLKRRSSLRHELGQTGFRKSFDVMSMVVSVKYITYLLENKKFAQAIGHTVFCKQQAPFGNDQGLQQVFRKQAEQMCLQSLPVPSVCESREIYIGDDKHRSLSTATSRPFRLFSKSKERKVSVTAKQETRARRQFRIGAPTLAFLQRPLQKTQVPSFHSVYNCIATIKKRELTCQDLRREIEQFNDKQKFKNAPLIREGHVTKETSLLKKSKLVIKRTRANESVNQNIVHCILMRNLVQTDVKFVYFGVETPCMVSIQLHGKEQLSLCIRLKDLQYSHPIRREDSENNRQFLTEWPTAKYLFKRWLKKEELLKNIDRVLSVSDYDIQVESLPPNLRTLQRPEIMELTELREIMRLFLKSTLYRKRKPNGWRNILNNKTSITKVCSKNLLMRSHTLRTLEAEFNKLREIIEMVEQYECPLIEQHILLHQGDYVVLSVYLNSQKFAQRLSISGCQLVLDGCFVDLDIKATLWSSETPFLESHLQFPLGTDDQDEICDIVLHLLKLTIFGHAKSLLLRKLFHSIQRITFVNNDRLMLLECPPPVEFGSDYQYSPHEEKETRINTFDHIFADVEMPQHQYRPLKPPISSSMATHIQPGRLTYGIYDRKITMLQPCCSSTLLHSLYQHIPLVSDPVEERTQPTCAFIHCTYRFEDYLADAKTELFVEVFTNRKQTDEGVGWTIKLTAFESTRRYRQLRLTNHDYYQLTGCRSQQPRQAIQTIRKKLVAYRMTPYSRLALTTNTDVGVMFVNSRDFGVGQLEEHPTAKLLSPLHQAMYFVASKIFHREKGYATMLIYRISHASTTWYNLEFHLLNGQVWASLFGDQYANDQQFRRRLVTIQLVSGSFGKYSLLGGQPTHLQRRLLLKLGFNSKEEIWVSEVTFKQSSSGNEFHMSIFRGNGSVDHRMVLEAQLLALYRVEESQNSNQRNKVTLKALAKYLYELAWNGQHQAIFK